MTLDLASRRPDDTRTAQPDDASDEGAEAATDREIDPARDLDALVNSFRMLMLHHSRVLGHQSEKHGLGTNDVRFLAYVAATGDTVTPKRAAEYLELSSGSMTSLVDRMLENGHLTRVPNPSDRRSVLIGRTAKGIAATQEITDVYRASFAEAFPAERFRGLAADLLDMAAAIDRNGSAAADEE